MQTPCMLQTSARARRVFPSALSHLASPLTQFPVLLSRAGLESQGVECWVRVL
jgi:hypothetical protein